MILVLGKSVSRTILWGTSSVTDGVTFADNVEAMCVEDAGYPEVRGTSLCVAYERTGYCIAARVGPPIRNALDGPGRWQDA